MTTQRNIDERSGISRLFTGHSVFDQILTVIAGHRKKTHSAGLHVRIRMNTWKRTIKRGLVAGACGVGLCALARKLKLSSRVADLAHSVEGVPFPGPNLYSFLASKQMRSMFSTIAREITSARHFPRILDLNTGVGFLPIEIAQNDPASTVVGIDRSPDMIQIAQVNARAAHVEGKVEFGTGEPVNLPFPGRYFDLAVSVNSLHHWSDPIAVLEEVYHVLLPGGQFWIYDYRAEASADIWESVESKLPLYLSLPFMVGPKASWKVAYKEEELKALIERTHFEDVRIEERTYTLFGQQLPVFNRIVMRKPEQPKE